MTAGELPRIRVALGLYVRGPDEVEIRSGTTNAEHIVLSDPEQRGLLARVVERLVSPEGRELNSEETAFLEELLPYLRECGVLEEAAPQSASRLLNPAVSQLRLAVVGDGFLGTRVAELLQPIGFAEVAIFRSSATSSASLRVDAAPRPNGADEWQRTLAPFALVIAAQDCFEPEELREINCERLRSSRPWSLICLDGREAWIGPTFAPGSTACFGCFERRLLNGPKATHNVLGEPGLRLVRLPRPGGDGAEAGLRTTYIASLFALDVCAIIAGGGFTLGSMVVIKLDTLAMQRETVLRLPRCPICSRARGEPAPNIFASILPSEPV